MAIRLSIFIITIGLLLQRSIVESRLYDSGANQEELQKRFDRYSADLTKLRAQVTSLKQQISKAKGDTSLGISSLQETMANERDTLFNIQSYLSLPFNYSLCDCYTFTEEQKSKLTEHVSTLRQSIEVLQKNAALEVECRLMQDVKSEAQRQLGYVDGLDKILKSDCCGKRTSSTSTQSASGIADLSTSQYQTNIKAKNWIYDGLSASELRLRYFSWSASRNVTNCPIETPFASGGKCINCEGDSPIWSMRLERCLGCPAGSVFNESSKSCWKSETNIKTSQSEQVVEPDKEEIEVVQPIKSKLIRTKTTTTSKTGEKLEEHEVEPQVGKKIRREVLANSNIRYASSSSTSFSSSGSQSSSGASTTDVEEQVSPIVRPKIKRTVQTASQTSTSDDIVQPIISEKIRRHNRHLEQSA